jgi:transposase
MEKAKTANRYSVEVRSRAVRMVSEHGADHASQWAAIGSIAATIGCTAETSFAHPPDALSTRQHIALRCARGLRGWVRQAERDQGKRAGPTSDDRERIKALEREIRELRQANEILWSSTKRISQTGSKSWRPKSRLWKSAD